MATYLDIVNNVILESKATLDPLTAANFDNPPRTRLYNDIKRWVNVAYKELLMRRNEAFSRSERAIVYVWPRLQISGLNYTPSIGDVLKGQTSGVMFTVMGVHTAEDVDNSNTLEFTLSVSFLSTTPPQYMVLGEQVTRMSPVYETDVGHVKGAGYIDFKQEVSGLAYVDDDSIAIEMTSNATMLTPVRMVPWDSMLPEQLAVPWTNESPSLMYKNRQGTYGLWPHINRQTRISFSYVRTLPQLVEWDDEPTELPPDYSDLIMWKAVAELADFDSNTRLFARANKHIEFYLNTQERDEMPTVFLDLYRFDGNSGSY